MNTYEVVIKYTHKSIMGDIIEGAAINRVVDDSAIKAFNYLINTVTEKVGKELNIYEVHIEEK